MIMKNKNKNLGLEHEKDETQEENEPYQQEIQQERKKGEEVLKLIRAKNTTMKQLSELNEANSQQILDSREQTKAYEEGVALKYNEILTRICKIHKAEVEVLERKLRSLELVSLRRTTIPRQES